MINTRIGVGEYIEILNTTTPSSTINKLYRVGSSLYWNGNELSTGGGVTKITRNITENITLDSTSEKMQILTSNAAYNITLSDDLSDNDFFIIQNNNTTGTSYFAIYQTYSTADYLLDYIQILTTAKYYYLDGRWHKDMEFRTNSVSASDVDGRISIGLLNSQRQDYLNDYYMGSIIIGYKNTNYATEYTIIGVNNNITTGFSTGVVIGISNTSGNSNNTIIGNNNNVTNGYNTIIGNAITVGDGNNCLIGRVINPSGVQSNNTIIGMSNSLLYVASSDIVVGSNNVLGESTYTKMISNNSTSTQSYCDVSGNYAKSIRHGEQIRTPNGGSSYTGSSYGTCILEGLFNNTDGSLYLLGSIGSVFILKESSILNFSVRLVIYEYDAPTPVAALGGYTWRGVIGVSPAGVGSFIGVPVEESWLEVGFGDATCSISIVDSTPDYFNIAYTKNTSTKNVYIMATIEYTELNLASR